MKIMKRILGVSLTLTCMIFTVTAWADSNSKSINEVNESNYVVETNSSKDYIHVRGIPVLSLEKELTKHALLSKEEQLESHKIIKEIKKHLKQRDYDKVQDNYTKLDILVNNNTSKDDEKLKEQIRINEEKARLEHEKLIRLQEENMSLEDEKLKKEEAKLIAQQLKLEKEALLQHEKLLAENEKARLEYEKLIKEQEEKMIQDDQKRKEEEAKLIAQQLKLEKEARLAYENRLEEERAQSQYEQQENSELENNELENNTEQENSIVVSLTKEEILKNLTRTSFEAQLKVIAQKNYIASKDISGYLDSYDKMKNAQKDKNKTKAEKLAKNIKEIIDYYVSFQ